MKQYMHGRARRGATAIFIVIFAALLMTILVVGFLRIMVEEQQRATNSDLSQSAYDSALAGVEDAKRAIQLCMDEGEDSRACEALRRQQCDTIQHADIVSASANEEVIIQKKSGGDGKDLDQAYTCVKVRMDTEDYRGTLSQGKTLLVPLRGVKDIEQIEIAWQLKDSREIASDTIAAAGGGNDLKKLYPNDSGESGPWSKTPAMLRAQVIAPGEKFKIEDLNTSDASYTTFLYPYVRSSDVTASIDTSLLNRHGQVANVNQPHDVTCLNGRFVNGEFACKVAIRLRQPIQGGSNMSFLRLNTMYRDATISIVLRDSSGSVVAFDGVQPTVDSTGRANDLFRRVESRLSLDSDIEYPENAVDLTGSLCKDFSITDTSSFDSNCNTRP